MSVVIVTCSQCDRKGALQYPVQCANCDWIGWVQLPKSHEFRNGGTGQACQRCACTTLYRRKDVAVNDPAEARDD